MRAFLVRCVDFSAYGRSTVTSAKEEYLHALIDAKRAEVFSNDSGNADTENSDRPERTGVRNYVTNEYARLLRSRKDVVRRQSPTIRGQWKGSNVLRKTDSSHQSVTVL